MEASVYSLFLVPSAEQEPGPPVSVVSCNDQMAALPTQSSSQQAAQPRLTFCPSSILSFCACLWPTWPEEKVRNFKNATTPSFVSWPCKLVVPLRGYDSAWTLTWEGVVRAGQIKTDLIVHKKSALAHPALIKTAAHWSELHVLTQVCQNCKISAPIKRNQNLRRDVGLIRKIFTA